MSKLPVLVLIAAVLLAACGNPAGRGAVAASAAGSAPQGAAGTASPMPTFNMADMMGFYPQQTVFVADAEKVSAVTLLNHFTRYTIPTRGKAQVAVDMSTAIPLTSLYILDGLESGSARLRAFDFATGTERASRSGIGTVASPVRALAVSANGRVLVLKSDPRRAWIDAYAAQTLEPAGPILETAGCADRLLASPVRIALACLATGEIVTDDHPASALGAPLRALAGVAMSADGAIYAVTTDGRLGHAGYGDGRLAPVPWPPAWTGKVLPDGVAAVAGAASLVIAQQDSDGAWLRVLATNVLAPRSSVRIPASAFSGILAHDPFAYFTSGGSVRHVELQSGLTETMTELGQGATIAAVVDR